jgi:hypothetical protein
MVVFNLCLQDYWDMPWSVWHEPGVNPRLLPTFSVIFSASAEKGKYRQ